MATKKKRKSGGYSLPILECLNCHHRWIPRVSKPDECPKCKGRKWKRSGTYSNSGV